MYISVLYLFGIFGTDIQNMSLPFQVILPLPVENSFSVLYIECKLLFEKFNAWMSLHKVDWHNYWGELQG
jgi:hypothetical protein